MFQWEGIWSGRDGGGLFPVSISISISSVFPMSPLLLEIILSNRLHRSWNLPLVSSLIWASFKSTFLCVSMSAGDLIKFVAVVRTLWRSVSASMGANWANVHHVRSGTQFLGVVSRLSISNTSPSVSSFSVKAMTCFFGRYKCSVLLRLMIT